MSDRKPRVYVDGFNTWVIGTDDMQAACKVLGISPETHKWGSTDAGMYCKRNRGWTNVSFRSHVPKDAKPGVNFHGRIQAKATPVVPVSSKEGS